MRFDGKVVIVTGAVSGLGGDWAMAAYDASKGAIVNLTRAMALDHGRDGVRVNSGSRTWGRASGEGPFLPKAHKTLCWRA